MNPQRVPPEEWIDWISRATHKAFNWAKVLASWIGAAIIWRRVGMGRACRKKQCRLVTLQSNCVTGLGLAADVGRHGSAKKAASSAKKAAAIEMSDEMGRLAAQTLH